MNPYEDMRLFTQVLDAGSFTAAAHQLGASKQWVSRRVMALEARLGVRLLNRSTRRLAVTPLGQAYYDAALRLLADLEQVEQSITGAAGAVQGTLRVSAPLSFAVEHLSPLLPAFLQAYPQVSVELELSDRNVDLLAEGFDLALRIGALEDSSLVARGIADIERVWCASPIYLAEYGLPATPAELERHRCLPYGHGGDETWHFERGGKVLNHRVTGRLRANNGEVLREAAAAGLGIAHLPLFIVASALSDGRLVRVLDDWRPSPLRLSALYPRHRQSAIAVQALVTYLQQALGCG
ncbi:MULTISPECIES: LysR family transcriptional regulator [unclassified Pseudomonas]|uniref:LysR family transcriptional regulator n=1 Tax=unclassified Pseudomonas TaxID=196821 RepID=UPI000BE40D13|nr:MULTISPECIES: LysR family transcriptional regulator [unclassified Pseudomonas]